MNLYKSLSSSSVSASGSVSFVKPDVLASGRVLTYMTPVPSVSLWVLTSSSVKDFLFFIFLESPPAPPSPPSAPTPPRPRQVWSQNIIRMDKPTDILRGRTDTVLTSFTSYENYYQTILHWTHFLAAFLPNQIRKTLYFYTKLCAQIWWVFSQFVMAKFLKT